MSKTFKNNRARFDDDDYSENYNQRERHKKIDSWKIERLKNMRRENAISDKSIGDDENEDNIHRIS